ncbi:Nucleoside phosphorylase [Ilyonectria robusta]
MEMLDEEHEPLPRKRADHNVYKLGSINNHNIVVAGLPQTGNCSAATVVTQMRMTFPNLEYGLLVGIGGGVPVQTDSGMIRLGHVVVSKPTGIHSGAVQYDHGKAKAGHFEQTGAIPLPPAILLSATQALAVQRERLDRDPVWEDVQRTQKNRRTIRRFRFPGITNDHLYPPDYTHQRPGQSCNEGGCDPEQRIEREIDESDESFVVVHRGTIASGELVIKDAALRDSLAEQHGLLCFEMEAAGALAGTPCMVIRGISDYCDSHKNDQWHGYAAAVAAAYARQLFFHLPKEEAQRNSNTQSNSATFQLPINLSEIFEVTRFVARKEELGRIHDILKGTIGRRTVILHGLGGIGKTQLAIAYFKRHRTDYSTAIWLNARDETVLKQSFARIAERIMRHDPSMTYISSAVESRDADRIVEAVKRWLDEPPNDHWLLIYDNYDRPKLTSTNAISSGQPDLPEDHTDEATKNPRDHADPKAFDLRRYQPETDHGAIIVTSRLSVKLGQSIQLGKLKDISDSLEILASASRRDSIKQDPAAHDLALQLDGLPLALATVGAYLEQVSMTCTEYLQLYHQSWLQLHKEAPQLPSYDQTLYSTWGISYKHIEQQSPIAAMLLRQWAYFSNEDLWYELLKDGGVDRPEWLTEMTNNKLQFHGIMRILCSHGLVEADPPTTVQQAESRGYSVHGCVHSWMIHVLNREFDEDMVQTAIHCVASHMPVQNQREFWFTQRRLLAQADRCLETMRRVALDYKAVVALGSLGILYTDQGRLQDAEAMYQRALDSKEKAWGPDHISTLHTVNNLGSLYADQGRLQDAEAMYQRALHSKEKAWGPDHKSTLSTVNNLGNLYQNQGRLQDAEAMYQRALGGYEKAWGPDHTSTLDTVSNLGSLYKTQGRLQDAKKMYQRAMDGYEKALGPTLVATYIPALITLENFAFLCVELGQVDEALLHYRRARNGVEAVWGRDSQRYTRLSDALRIVSSFV